jgi:Ca2+-binding EF-hand superfamily protein
MDNSGVVSKDEIYKVLKACEIDIDASEAEDIIN